MQTSKCSDLSAADTGHGARQLDKPTGIRATDGAYGDRVQVTWNPVADAVVYRVFRCMDTGQTCGSPIGFPKTISFDDKRGDSEVVYYYRVRACTADNCGKFSAANTGHRGGISSTESDERIMVVEDEAIPDLNDVGRWLLILMMLGAGLLLIDSGYIRRQGRL